MLFQTRSHHPSLHKSIEFKLSGYVQHIFNIQSFVFFFKKGELSSTRTGTQWNRPDLTQSFYRWMYVLLQIFECFVYLHSSFYKAQYLGPDTYPTYLKGRLFECLRKHCPDHFDVLSHDQNWQLGCLWQLSIQSSRDGCRFCRWSKLFPKNTMLSSKHELVPLPETLTK